MFIIVMGTESKEFVALGTTEENVKKALVKEWNSSQREAKKHFEAFEPWIVKDAEELQDYYGFTLYELEPNTATSMY